MPLIEVMCPWSAVPGIRWHKPSENYIAEIGYHKINHIGADGSITTKRVRTTHYFGDRHRREEAEAKFAIIKKDWEHCVADQRAAYEAENAERKAHTVTKTRKTYAQDWPNYNAAQVNEKRHFQELLAELCKGIDAPVEDKPKGGRPTFPLADAIYAVVSKVYSTHSGRRFVNDLNEAKEKGFIDELPHYNTIFKFIENPELYPILMAMIERASLPLKDIESQFSVDSTGFAYSRFVRWFDIKYNRFTEKQQWIKAHICTGTKTNVVTAVEIHSQDASDSENLPPLVETTAKNFKMMEISADKGYSDRRCHNAIAGVGAKPYIMFKANTTGEVGGLFKKMFHYFQFKRDEFLAHLSKTGNWSSRR